MNAACRALIFVVLGMAAARVCADETNKIVITSDRMDFDYGNLHAVFAGNVVVSNVSMRMESRRLDVGFDADQTVESIVASSDVKLRYGDCIGFCDKAVYLAATGKVILAGRADLKAPGRSVKADRITVTAVDGEVRFAEAEGSVRMSYEQDGSTAGRLKIGPGAAR